MVRLVWLGGLIMALGGMLAVIGRRQRVAVTAQDTLPATTVRGQGVA
jgi:cytochrome c-type biogenesis protein CcmF